MADDDLIWLGATEIATAVRTGQLSPVDVVSRLIERIEEMNPKLNAFITLTLESAVEQAQKAEEAVARGDELGPLHGVPVAIKDTMYTRGVRTTIGSRLNEDNIPDRDSVCVARLREAGTIMLGKTNVPEFGLYPVTKNPLFGISRNPWNLERTPGGSSGGSAAAIAAGLCPIATGSDGGGSIRTPANFCGVYGLKPQLGRIPVHPPGFGWLGFSHMGPLSRTVRDAALMLDVMAGHHWADRASSLRPWFSFLDSLGGGVKGLRVAWSPDLGFGAVSREVRTVLEEAVKAFAELGAVVEDATPDLHDANEIFYTLMPRQFISWLTTLGPLEELEATIDPESVRHIREYLDEQRDMTIDDYVRAGFSREELTIRVGRFFEDYDLLLSPVSGVPAWSVDLEMPYVSEIDGRPVEEGQYSFTSPFNLTGQPAASIPAGWTTDGLPVGLQIVGRQHDEATVLRASAAFERERPWNHRKPPV